MQIKTHSITTGETVIREATPEEEASITAPQPLPDPRVVLDEAEAAAAKADNQVMTFLNWTPAEFQAWLNTNIADANTRTALSVLGRIARTAGRGRSLR